MTHNFKIPQKLQENVSNTWGQQGKIWLIKLPDTIAIIAKYWNLTEIKSVVNISYNYVAFALKDKKIPVVIKISCDKNLIIDEYLALLHFQGSGSIKVLDVNKEANALLLEQAISGNSLKEIFPYNIKKVITNYAKVVKFLSKKSAPKSGFLHVANWCSSLDNIKDKRIKPHFVELAYSLKKHLLNSLGREYLCHGDLHLDNIVKHGNKWLAIDPYKGTIGDMAFEASAFDLISKQEILQDTSKLIKEKIVKRVGLLSESLNLSFDKLLSWIFLRSILSAQWFIEDNMDPTPSLFIAEYVYFIFHY